MKKIFGVLSLIAILTVAFTTQANAADDSKASIEMTVSFDSLDLAPTFTAIVPTVGVFFNIETDVSGNYAASEEDAGSATIVTGIKELTSYNDANEVATIEPINTQSNFEYGLIASLDTELTTNLPETIPDLNNYVNEYNENYGSTSLIKDIATNVGKFTKPTYIF